jgi:DNA-binding MarR family transcriptional regulator
MSQAERGRGERLQERRPGSGHPPTVLSPALLDADGSDWSFRRFIYDLFTVAAWMEVRREYLASRINVTSPQFSVMLAIANLSTQRDVTVGAVAALVRVSGPFVTVETNKLVKLGLVEKRTNPRDRRSVLLSLSKQGHALVREVAIEMRRLNDAFFGKLSAERFSALRETMAILADSAEEAIGIIEAKTTGGKPSRLSRWQREVKRRTIRTEQ